MKLKAWLVFFISSLTACESSKILFICASLSRSHVLPLQVLAKALIERDHEVTFVSAFPLGQSMKNYREIKINVDDEDTKSVDQVIKLMSQNPSAKNFATLFRLFTTTFYKIGNDTLNSADVQRLMREESFDLVLSGYFMSEYMLGLADHFKCPSVVFFSGSYMGSVNKMVGNPAAPTGASHTLHGNRDLSSFVSRLKNFIINGVDLLVMRPYFNYRAKLIYDENFPADQYRSYEESLRNISLVLINTHFSSVGPRPNLPNMVEVGGLQINPKPLPLPADMKEFLDNAKDGAIIFSLGSNAKSIYIAEEKINALLKVFSKLKQRVVMKWESETMPGKPDNVLISKWLPQSDVLAHPNIKLFISHCGFGGVVEAMHSGVPIIGIPLGGDQSSNADKIVKEGWAIRIDYDDVNEQTLSSAISEILSNRKYGDVVKRESLLLRDRPLNAQDTAVYWIEYVLRHHGAPHLHYPAADLNFLQENSVDVVVVIMCVFYLAWQLLKRICRFIFCRRKKTQKLKRN